MCTVPTHELTYSDSGALLHYQHAITIKREEEKRVMFAIEILTEPQFHLSLVSSSHHTRTRKSYDYHRDMTAVREPVRKNCMRQNGLLGRYGFTHHLTRSTQVETFNVHFWA
jgi:hypothetical protein